MLSTPTTRPSEGVTVLPLRTPTLPPATRTNTVLLGRRDVWIVDPATPWPDARAALEAALDAEEAAGRRLAGIVLTHHHADHVGAAGWLAARRGLRVLGHPRTRELLAGTLDVEPALVEGEALVGSGDADDTWQILHTPGHASGHVVLWEPRRGALVAGDMVAAEGTIVVEPPDGHMATYIAQLERLASLAPRWIVPAHGAVVEDAVGLLRHYVAHRLEREGRVVAALAAGEADLPTLTERSYPDVPRAVLPLARRSCLAHLHKLVEEGRARATAGDRWAPLTVA